MDFSITDEQVQLADAVRRFCAGEYPYELRGERVDSERREQRWAMMAELGLTALSVAEDFGGMGQGMAEQMLVVEELGRCLSPEPYLNSAVIAPAILQQLGTTAQCNDWLAPLAEGRAKVALAVYEPDNRYDASRFSTSVEATADGFCLNGEKALVLDGLDADAYLVASYFNFSTGLFLVPRDAEGLSVTAGTTLDNRDLARLSFHNVKLSASARLGSDDADVAAVLEASLDRAVAALCAEGVGAMAELVEQTAEFLKVRKQFGAPLAKFQSLQHRLVDVLIELEQSRSMAGLAAMAIDEAEPARRRQLVSAAKVQICRAARKVSKEAIQMHGAMGMTDECRVGHYVKRLMMIEQLCGDAHHHLNRFSSESAVAG